MNYPELRSSLIAAHIAASPANMQQLVAGTEVWLKELATVLPKAGMALVAVGGFGRNELLPGSDLDLLLLHEPKLGKLAVELADKLWYPIWDAGLKLDHSVRDLAQARNLAGADFKVVLGLLDSRVIAGDEQLFQKLKSTVLADWRSAATKRLPELQEDVKNRRSRAGDLAHLLEPDLKDSYGGLRDLTVLRAISASWLTDIEHTAVKPAGIELLQVRDALHRVTGRASDRLSFHDQSAVAQLQGFESDDALLRHVSLAGRAIAQASDQAWNRIERQTTRRGIRRLEPRRDRYPLADGVVVQNGEVVLAREADPSSDATLLLRAAGAAAQAGLPLAPHTIERLAEQTPPIQVPWPSSAQNAFVSLLGSGPALLPVWEALDQAGIFSRLLPHWERIRSAPQRNALHQYTVDRHCVETVVQASALTREVSRPDLLLVGALFHDIGKAQGKGHSEIGETLIRQIAPTLGFSVGDTETLARLVLYHLLLAETATTRDLEDPATIEMVAAAVGNLEVLQLLRQLTEADSKATNDGIWTDWKARLVNTLCEKVEMQLTGEKLEPVDSFVKRSGMLNLEPGEIHISRDSAGFVVRLCAIDRMGLVANVAGIWALEKLEVISADFDTIGGVAYQEWLLRPVFGDPVSEQELIQQVQRGLSAPDSIAEAVTRLVPARQSRRGYAVPPMRFKVEHLGDATVIEVRAHDTAGMLYKICTQIAAKKLNIRNARIATLGSEVVDAIYLQNAAGARLANDEVADLEAAIREALQNSES